MSSIDETVMYEVSAGVATVKLNRPAELNAWNPQLAQSLHSALETARTDASVRAIALTGSGRAFSSGTDLKSGITLTPSGRPDVLTLLRDHYNPVIKAVRDVPKPVIAALNGPAVGIGASLALAADLIVAAESAYFLFAFANVGLSVDGGASLLLSARLGFTRAADLGFLAHRLSASKALEWGLVNRVVPDDELASASGSLTRQLSEGPPGAFATIKAILNDRCFSGLPQVLDDEAVLQQQRAESPEFTEGRAAFLEKRRPRFGAPSD